MSTQVGDEGLFDPFWVLFKDEESDEEKDLRTFNRKGKQTTPVGRNEGSGMLNFFMPEENNAEIDREERQPSAIRKKEQRKIQHYWRRNKEGGRLSFGRRSTNSKRNGVPSSSNSFSSFASPEQRDVHEKEHEDNSTVEENNDVFPVIDLPSFTEAFSTPWDPWGDQTSSSGSSGASYISDETEDAESLASFASLGSASFETQEPPQVEQIMVQFNPVVDSMHGNVTSLNVLPEPTPDQEGFLPKITNDEGSTVSRNSAADESYFRDETSSSMEKMSLTQGFQSNIDFDVVDEERKPSSCVSLQRVCGISGKHLERKLRLSFCRSSKIHDGDRDLTTTFPKLRMVADDKEVGLDTPAVVSNSNKFKGNVPAHLQLSSDAFLAAQGPQSLYEYEYDGGEHIDVAYNHFGPNPMSLLVIRHHEKSPRMRPNGAIIQIEVRHVLLAVFVLTFAFKISQLLTANFYLVLCICCLPGLYDFYDRLQYEKW